MQAMVSCQLSADALSEVRRKVHQTRKDAKLPTTSGEDVQARLAEIISHDVRVITEFVTEEFEADVVALFTSRVAPDEWPEPTSWDYPGPWINSVDEIVTRILDGDDSAFIFSKSGDHNLRITKLTQG